MVTLRSSFLYSFSEKYTLLLLSTAGAMVLARLLTPAEIGLYSIAAVLLALAQAVRDFGVGPYLIQEAQLNMEKLRAALAVSLGVAWLLGGLVLLASTPLAHFYHEPRLAGMLQLLALNFVLIPFSALTLPLLRRELRFGAIFAINASNAVVSLAVSVALALLGFGYMSLVWGTLAGSAATLLASLCCRPRQLPWLPGWKGSAALLRFGALSTGGGLIDELGVAAPGLIIGKLIGVAPVGLFSRAQGLLGVFNQAITSAVSPVVFPLFARRVRDATSDNGYDAANSGAATGAGQTVADAYLTTIAYMTALSWPFFVFLGCMALPLVKLFYGHQWDAAAPLIRIMCFSSAMYSMFSMARYLFVAIGAVEAQARLDALTVPLRVVLLLGAARFGLDAVAWAVVLGTALRCWLTYRALVLLAGINALPMLRAVRKSVLLTAASAPGPLLVLAWGGDAGGTSLGPLALALAGLLALAGWLGAVLWSQHPIAAELTLLRRRWLFPT